jgi:hypothetical protein
MSRSKRQYESPRLVQYGDLVTLTRGTVPTCASGYTPGKLYGSGDDLSSQIPLSPWTCIPTG